jgi:hypothetical protein
VNDERSEREHEIGQPSGVPDKLGHAYNGCCTYTVMKKGSNLFAFEQCVKYETSVGECVGKDGVPRLYNVRVGQSSVAHLCVTHFAESTQTNFN